MQKFVLSPAEVAHRGTFPRRRVLRSLCGAGMFALTQAAWPAVKGDIAPDCATTTPDDALTVRLADFKGSVVYLDFWASWCPPCRESFPFMNELQHDFGHQGLQIMAVSVDKTPDDARRFLKRFPPQFTVVLDPKWTCASAYLLPGMPTSFIIDKAGVVRVVHVGFRDDDKVAIRQQLTQLINQHQ